MGSSVDSRRIDHVLRRHRDDLVADLRADNSSKLVRRFTLQPGIDALGVRIHLSDGSSIDVPRYWDVDALIERFPDCA
jgi:hypothetical protein